MDEFSPYLPGSSFYKIDTLSGNNLIKIIKDHTNDYLSNQDQICPLYGGYVLRINDVDIYFPQCCGDLGDIRYWESLVLRNKPEYYAGHPEPTIQINENDIILDFDTGEYDEPFTPPPAVEKLIIDKNDLYNAIKIVKIQLDYFADSLISINLTEKLNVSEIDKRLIWGDYSR